MIFDVTLDAIYVANFEIEANSQEEADALVEQHINSKNLDFSMSKGSIGIVSVDPAEPEDFPPSPISADIKRQQLKKSLTATFCSFCLNFKFWRNT